VILADIGMIDPCSWLTGAAWWIAGCWLPFSGLGPMVALTTSLLVAVLVRQRRLA